jgi:hypothetical protein
MDRYTRIDSVTFDQTALPLPLSVKLSRTAEAKPAGSDSDAFATSIEIGQPVIIAEVRIRGTNTAESLSVGQQGDLSFTVGVAASGGTPRDITISGAVLTAVELDYEQASLATALLRFIAEASGSSQDPFSAEDSQ